jgi:NADPH-dependent glutamate synthase beta subunit-like oxidoreductase
MDSVRLSIDRQSVEVRTGTTILEAARQAGIYIPVLCHHPDLPPASTAAGVAAIYRGNRKIENTLPEEPAKACGLCVVQIDGRDEPVSSCVTAAENGMAVVTDNERIRAKRRENLILIMTRHRHACLTCAQQEGCERTQCSANVPENERCCSQFGHCELQNVATCVGIAGSTPKWIPTDLAVMSDSPLFEKDDNLCIGCTRCVRACRDLRGVEAIGFVYDENGQIQVGTLAKTLAESGCRFCTACVEVCPTGALVDKFVEAGSREQDLLPCKAACPVHIDIPGYLRMIAHGRTDEANAIIREKVPFPGVLGRVCIHPCEQVCRCGEVNESISVCALKRYAADGDNGLWRKGSRVAGGTGKKVAVIGAGPAGLTVAFYLCKQGHTVCVFDASSQPGGMMRYGIPRFRLPREVLNREINDIFDLGIDFKPNQRLGRNFTLEGLKNDGYDAVFLGVGAQQNRRISPEGCNSPDVIWGVELLRQAAEGRDVKLKGSVLVIGGGNVAVDVALTALRCGATDVRMACLEGLDEMPASPWEIEEARQEGVQILYSWGPDKILSQDGKVIGMDLVQCTCVFDEQGNLCPEFSDKKKCIRVDQIIMALGQAVDLSFLEENSPIKAERGLILVDEDTLETGMPGVYAGGDATRTPGTIIHAIGAGRRAAESIDQALGGCGQIDEVLFERGRPDDHLGREEGFAAFAREKVPVLDVANRVNSFREVAIGYSPEQAAREAGRCLQCDLRLNMGCNPPPPAVWRPFDETHVDQVPEAEGVFQLADTDHKVMAIKGAANLRRELLLSLDENETAAFFEYEEDKMYSQRESELIQKYTQAYGEMPGTDVDDLF